MGLLWKTFFLALVAASLLFLARMFFYPKPAPQSPGEAVNRMIALQDDGRYDEAARTVQTWLQNNPRNASRDGLLYQQIAMVYVIKAYKSPETREDSVRQAALNFDNARILHDKEQSSGLDTELFELGSGYEHLGDLSVAEKCKFYEEARQLFEKQAPLIQSETYTASGKTFSLKPLQVEVKKHLDAVREKLSSSGCQANGKL
ncbi:MAG TPA: hypothetical protein VGR58_14955 [Candidatus Acidoferrum sp.]|nr:hypothetical protein [Candidatus Acidoferrum sp.]